MPRIDFVTNKPFNLDATGFDKKHYFHVSMSEDYESKKENNFFSASELMAKMKEILDDPENFPDS